MRLPSAYQAGYDKARAFNPDLATKYVEHTVIGDPEASMLDDLSYRMPDHLEADKATPW